VFHTVGECDSLEWGGSTHGGANRTVEDEGREGQVVTLRTSTEPAAGDAGGPPSTPVSERSTANRSAERLVDAGATLAIYLPDSVLTGVTRALDEDPRIPTIVCTREDEGAAIAAGAALAGGLPVLLMEGSGVGYCGLILARAQVMHAGFLLVASHSPALGERFDYHQASRVVGAGVFEGLGIPYVTPRSADELVDVAGQALETVRGQRTVVGVLVPPATLR
jgi:sulfopyruvate decarboxylase subunit alpha